MRAPETFEFQGLGHKVPPGRGKGITLNHEVLMDKFWKQVAIGEPSACWEWQGSRSSKRYGRFFDAGTEVGAHRKAWELANGEPVPADLNVCHSCDNPPCCNPAHLRVDTASGNMQERDAKRRGNNSRKTRCPEGHEYSEANTLYNAQGARLCRACVSTHNAKQREDAAFRERQREYLKEWRANPVAEQRTHCKRGHALTPENTYVKPNGYLECRTCALATRKARPPRNASPNLATHCGKGHEFTEANTYMKTNGDRECRACAAAAARARRARSHSDA